SGAMNMALDEVLLRECEFPVLRIYTWSEPTISFGYFGKIAAVRRSWPECALVRRWTGGGVVPHGSDFTYTLAIPVSSPVFRQPPLSSYQMIHECIARIISTYGLEARLVSSEDVEQGE